MRPVVHAPRRHRARAAGFTLIELLVTIGIMVLVLSFAVVAFRPIFGAAGLQSGARIVRAALDGARIRAIQQRRQVRFEAQLTPDDPKKCWRVSSNAGDLGQEWKPLPDFITVQTNAGSGGSDGRGDCHEGYERISITFGPDGSVVRYALGGNAPHTPSGLFALRLENTRDSDKTTDPPGTWIVIIPLTGGIEFGGQES